MKRSPRKPKPESPVAGAGSAAAVDFAAIEREIAALPAAPPGPRANTKRYQVERLREVLLDAMANRRQSPESLAELLAGLGIAIRPATLRRYLGPIHPHRTASAATSTATLAARPPAGQPATGAPSPARAVPVREADPGARPAAAAAAPAGAPDRSEAVLAAAPTPAPASSASAHSHLNLTSRFVPAPELPYDELIRQAKARKAQEAQ